jgi:hypothetical protein
MGQRISHMNVQALSTLVQAEEVDIENLLRSFEGKKQKFPPILHNGKEVENVPTRANAMEEQYAVDALEVVLERQEAEIAARKAAEEAALEEEKEKFAAQRAGAKAAGSGGKKKVEIASKEPEAKNAPAAPPADQRPISEVPTLNDVMPGSLVLPGFNSRFADEYEAKFEAELQPEEDKAFNLDGYRPDGDGDGDGLDPGSAFPSSPGAGGAKERGQDYNYNDDLTEGMDAAEAASIRAEQDDTFSMMEGGVSVVGSVVSVAGGGSIRSTTSVTAEMTAADTKVSGFYHEVKIGDEKGLELPSSYLIKLDDMLDLCRRSGFDDSDTDLVEAMFRLVDARGFEEADIRHVLVPFALCVGANNGSIAGVIRLIFSIFDRKCTEVVEKEEMIEIFNLCNEALLYVGDKPLLPVFITDLTDSIYTTAGRIDGGVQWVEYVELISEHPIIEMLIAPQVCNTSYMCV